MTSVRYRISCDGLEPGEEYGGIMWREWMMSGWQRLLRMEELHPQDFREGRQSADMKVGHRHHRRRDTMDRKRYKTNLILKSKKNVYL